MQLPDDTILVMPLLVISALILLFSPFQVKAQALPFQSDFNFTWTYQKIFTPQNIPLPASMNGVTRARVEAVYSPSVIKIQNKYYMFFGVSLYCNPNNGPDVARDSVALADSPDGINWTFRHYIIEPDPQACLKPQSQWGTFTYQVNDPSVEPDPTTLNQILVFYTTVISTQDNYGHIGLAKFDSNLNQTFRNDKFIPGTNVLGGPGYSRPDVQWTSPTTLKLWFDSGGHIGSTPLSNLSQLTNPPITNENYSGADINFPTLDYSQTFMLRDGGPVAAVSKDQSGTWSPTWFITQLSGQGWDSWYQGSPDMYLDNATCNPKLYFAGAVKTNTGVGFTLNIGMALPPAGKTFSFPVCNSTPPPPTPVPGDLTGDGHVTLADLMQAISSLNIFTYNQVVANFGK